MSTVYTRTVWNPLLTPTENATVQARANELFLAGEAISEYPTTMPNPGGINNNIAPMTVVRGWNSLESAQAWVAYLAPYNPLSSTIES
jgi:hypothetical protein